MASRSKVDGMAWAFVLGLKKGGVIDSELRKEFGWKYSKTVVDMLFEEDDVELGKILFTLRDVEKDWPNAGKEVMRLLNGIKVS